MNSFRHYPLFLLSLLYLSLAIGLIGCSDDDDPEVYPPMVLSKFGATAEVLPDSTVLVKGSATIWFRGQGHSCVFGSEVTTSSPGCFGSAPEDEADIYEIGDLQNLMNATAILNGVELDTARSTDPFGYYCEWPNDTEPLQMRLGDMLRLEVIVPNENQIPAAPIPLDKFPDLDLPEEGGVLSLSDTLRLFVSYKYTVLFSDTSGYFRPQPIASVWDEERMGTYNSYTFSPAQWSTGDTLALRVEQIYMTGYDHVRYTFNRTLHIE